MYHDKERDGTREEFEFSNGEETGIGERYEHNHPGQDHLIISHSKHQRLA